jgi:hypothetical protein
VADEEEEEPDLTVWRRSCGMAYARRGGDSTAWPAVGVEEIPRCGLQSGLLAATAVEEMLVWRRWRREMREDAGSVAQPHATGCLRRILEGGRRGREVGRRWSERRGGRGAARRPGRFERGERRCRGRRRTRHEGR